MNARLWMTADEAALYLQVTRRTLLSWTRLGRIRGYHLSGEKRHNWRFKREDLDAAMKPASAMDCGCNPQGGKVKVST
jgi:excisionase family DNA binding protein